jgi:iron complex transport system permease protein
MHPYASLSRTLAIVALMGGIALVALAVALATGSVDVSGADVIAALTGASAPDGADIVRTLRLPRALAGFAVGALLALAGALLQVLLRNPLADPYVLGISGGASVGALIATLAGVFALAAPAAFAGAALSTLVVFGLARRAADTVPWASTRLLLTGAVVAAGWSALIALLLALAPAAALKGMVYWLLGDLSGAVTPWPALAVLALVLAIALALARELNALARGETEAAALGVDVPRTTLAIHALAALATATAVTTAGSIGFVGLIVPHALRLALGNDQRALLPAAALAGGALLVGADTIARSIASPLELPVGVLTALIGVPAFLYLLARSR